MQHEDVQQEEFQQEEFLNVEMKEIVKADNEYLKAYFKYVFIKY